jgi:hypothetical protein
LISQNIRSIGTAHVRFSLESDHGTGGIGGLRKFPSTHACAAFPVNRGRISGAIGIDAGMECPTEYFLCGIYRRLSCRFKGGRLE